MLVFHERRLSVIAAGIMLQLLCSQPYTFARGSLVAHDDPWSSGAY